MKYKLKYGVVTDRGKKREINEDSLLVLPKKNFFAVADGMGGHYGGEVASNLAVDVLKEKINKNHALFGEDIPNENMEVFDRILSDVNQKIRDKSAKSKTYNDMGTTVVGLLFFPNTVLSFHVGDSRNYLLREGKLFQISYDHSWVNEQLRFNRLSTHEARTHKWKNVIMRAMGGQDIIFPEYSQMDISKGDLFVICSDGLSDMVPDRTLQKLLNRFEDPQEIANILLNEALKKGGLDNITIVVVRVA
ncbi:Stp1/IreP family PP2C-type Ser/Thr phosphatase [bacterium]|nr:Stp1/IreP family PP2C-type Ser/Thr phosphatase [bacterium]